MLGLLTTSRKAAVGALVTALYPFYALLQSDVEIGWRELLTCLVGGFLGGLSVWAPANTEPLPPPVPAPVRARHRAEG